MKNDNQHTNIMKKIFIICIAVIAIASLIACMNGASSPQPVAEVLLEDADVVKWYNSDSKVSMTFTNCEIIDETPFGSAEAFKSNKYIFTYDKQSLTATIETQNGTMVFEDLRYNKFKSDATAICVQKRTRHSDDDIRFIVLPAGKHYILNVYIGKYSYDYSGPHIEGWDHAATFTQK